MNKFYKLFYITAVWEHDQQTESEFPSNSSDLENLLCVRTSSGRLPAISKHHGNTSHLRSLYSNQSVVQ